MRTQTHGKKQKACPNTGIGARRKPDTGGRIVAPLALNDNPGSGTFPSFRIRRKGNGKTTGNRANASQLTGRSESDKLKNDNSGELKIGFFPLARPERIPVSRRRTAPQAKAAALLRRLTRGEP
jgi:hypothetical protein